VEGLSVQEAIGDEMRMAAFERKLEVLGEAAKRVSSEFAQKHPDPVARRNRAAQRSGP